MSIDIERLKKTIPLLIEWFDSSARQMPWRTDSRPYYVWLSEVMLQQTRVETVIPYFNRFIDRLPDVNALANVSEEELLKLWEGLGYYNRARNLKKAAIQLVEEYGGELPKEVNELKKLSGIGSYTAGAIASIAYNQVAPVVDGNVLRVVSRLLASTDDISQAKVKTQMEKDLLQVIPSDRPGTYNQALMELGALVCIPNGEPHCEKCPLQKICLAHLEGRTDSIPYKAPKKQRKIEKRTVLVIEYGDEVVLRKRPAKGLLAKMYEFPNMEGHLKASNIVQMMLAWGETSFHISSLEQAIHVFSHVEWHMIGYRVKLYEKQSNNLKFVKKEEVESKYAVPTAFHVYKQSLNFIE
jgi:A/G-specific adenine glycosylase